MWSGSGVAMELHMWKLWNRWSSTPTYHNRSGRIQNFVDSIKIEILLYLASISYKYMYVRASTIIVLSVSYNAFPLILRAVKLRVHNKFKMHNKICLGMVYYNVYNVMSIIMHVLLSRALQWGPQHCWSQWQVCQCMLCLLSQLWAAVGSEFHLQ